MVRIKISGTAIYIYERDNGGAVLVQGTSMIRLSKPEVDAVVAALRDTGTAVSSPQ